MNAVTTKDEWELFYGGAKLEFELDLFLEEMIANGVKLMETFREKRWQNALLSPSQVGVNWDDLDKKLLSPADVTAFYDEMW